MDNKLLKKLQNTELDILDAIHAYCEAHQIRYSLFYGTAIGAVCGIRASFRGTTMWTLS